MPIERKVRLPECTTQMAVCPIPFRYDTYCGCAHGCKYCFGRNLVEFSRRNCEGKSSFAYIDGNDPKGFSRWLNKIISSDTYDYNYVEKVAIKERIPLKIGTTSDPFPPMEPTERITYDTLKILDEHDYPVQILTKNPCILAEYIGDFDNPNWSIAVSLISTDEKFIRGIEPGAPSPSERLSAIESITERGYHVMMKVQPAILPKIVGDLPELVRQGADAGIWAFNTEGLKVRITMHDYEQKIFQEMTPYIGYDIRAYYKRNFRRTSSDYEPQLCERMKYIEPALELAKQYNIKYFVADNGVGKVGDGPECCGTQVLRNYKIWGGCDRVKFFGCPDYCSKELGKGIYRMHFVRKRPASGANRQVRFGDLVAKEEDLLDF